MKETIKILEPSAIDYPQNLLQIDTYPQKLYIKGEITKKDALAVAIVGTREMTNHGKDVAYKFSFGLAKSGITIVSGLARGIDSVAHQAALEAGGRTIAVFGCGLDICYPPENKELLSKICKQGAVISEFESGTPPIGTNFLQRNRLISGLSLAVLVIEAKRRSGTLSTATWAADQNREVFAIPGPPSSETSALPNYLIENGAQAANSPMDILKYLKNMS